MLEAMAETIARLGFSSCDDGWLARMASGALIPKGTTRVRKVAVITMKRILIEKIPRGDLASRTRLRQFSLCIRGFHSSLHVLHQLAAEKSAAVTGIVSFARVAGGAAAGIYFPSLRRIGLPLSAKRICATPSA